MKPAHGKIADLIIVTSLAALWLGVFMLLGLPWLLVIAGLMGLAFGIVADLRWG